MSDILAVAGIAGCLILALALYVWKLDMEIDLLRIEVGALKYSVGSHTPLDLARFNRKLLECEARCEWLKGSLSKLLAPIRSNAEDIDQLDDDLARLQALYEELKKRGESPPPAASP